MQQSVHLPDNAGTFYSFVGIDAAGKTSAARALCSALAERGAVFLDKHSLRVNEPYLSKQLDLQRELLWGDQSTVGVTWGDRYWALLLASWFSIVDSHVIGPWLDDGRIVVTDDWFYKMYARLALKSHLDEGFLRSLFGHLRRPDTTVLLDLDPEVAAARRTTFRASEVGLADGVTVGGPEGFAVYQRRVRAQLHHMACREGWLVLDSSASTPEEISAQVLSPRAPRPAVGVVESDGGNIHG